MGLRVRGKFHFVKSNIKQVLRIGGEVCGSLSESGVRRGVMHFYRTARTAVPTGKVEKK
jgi:hypothetical protein